MPNLSDQVQYVRGVGPTVAKMLAEKGVLTTEDLLYHLPFRYEDRQNPVSLDELKPGEVASVIGEVRGSALLRTRRMPLFELTVGQGRHALKCVWFNAPYLKDKFQAGQTVAVYGKVEPSRSTTNFKMIQPQFEILPDSTADAETQMLEVGRITPVYESLGGSRLASRWQRRVIFNLLESMRGAVPECLPQSMLGRLDFPDRETALREVHFPPEGTPLSELKSFSTPAHRRLIFEEFFFLELGLELKRRRMKERIGVAFATNDKVREAIREVLPFHPTSAQKRALGEIVADMRAPHPMRRLLQGDVGSGKTIVAFQAMLVAMENGYQAALMAPTEILATQHYLAARKLLERSSRKPRIVLLTGSLDEDRKRTNRGLINRGDANLIIGTHALIEEKVEFDRLGLVVVDEQHRFGVVQRFKLMKKPNQPEPDVLVMTATPIPRTLALSLYGDLDLSTLDELPPGRMPIVTRRMPGERADEVWDFVRKQVALGRQAYIVYPVIEGSKDDQPELDFSRDEAQAEKASSPTISEHKKSQKRQIADLFPGFAKRCSPEPRNQGSSPPSKCMKNSARVRSPDCVSACSMAVSTPTKKRSSCAASSAAKSMCSSPPRLSRSVSTWPTPPSWWSSTPSALASRSCTSCAAAWAVAAAKSYCILMTGERITDLGEERLNAMVETQDGFELADLDLRQRGPGEFFGTRQAGLPDFRVANLLRDRQLLELAKKEAASFVLGPEPEVTEAERAAVRSQLKQSWQRKYGLVEAG